MSKLSESLRHLRHDVQYPANRSQVLAACNNMSDLSSDDRDWVTKALPEGNYKTPSEVMTALLNKV